MIAQDRILGLVPAAGGGARLGLGPKAALMLNGRTLAARAVAALNGLCGTVVVALPDGVSLADLPPGTLTTFGGNTRQDSVESLLQIAGEDFDLVLVHDAARPFLPAGVLRAVAEAALQVGAATATLEVADTLVRAGAENASTGEPLQSRVGLVDRTALFAVQTPQGFRRGVLNFAHRLARERGLVGTDDAGLVSASGARVALVPGDARLFKVTTPGDWALAEAFAPAWDAEGGL